jgi:hypothetical protein
MADPRLAQPPGQWPVEEPAFRVDSEGITYTIEPKHGYDLHGMVVSYAHHDGNYSLHRLWSDHLNVADVCVVWGENAGDLDLNRFDFWNGKFTCNFQTHDAAAWKRFRENQISNNHLLAVDDRVRDAIREVRVGDTVRIRGWLAEYSNDRGFRRGTSTTREDRGNGACETLYVKDFTILDSMQNGWRTLLQLSLLGRRRRARGLLMARRARLSASGPVCTEPNEFGPAENVVAGRNSFRHGDYPSRRL